MRLRILASIIEQVYEGPRIETQEERLQNSYSEWWGLCIGSVKDTVKTTAQFAYIKKEIQPRLRTPIALLYHHTLLELRISYLPHLTVSFP